MGFYVSISDFVVRLVFRISAKMLRPTAKKKKEQSNRAKRAQFKLTALEKNEKGTEADGTNNKS